MRLPPDVRRQTAPSWLVGVSSPQPLAWLALNELKGLGVILALLGTEQQPADVTLELHNRTWTFPWSKSQPKRNP